MNKYLLLHAFFFTSAIFTIPKTKEEKKIEQHAYYLKRKALKAPRVTRSFNRDEYKNHPLLKLHYQNIIVTPEYLVLKQARVQSRKDCLNEFRASSNSNSNSKVMHDRKSYNKIYYALTKDKNKALRDTLEYKAYQLRKKELSQGV